jgi:hypothetical protein
MKSVEGGIEESARMTNKLRESVTKVIGFDNNPVSKVLPSVSSFLV